MADKRNVWTVPLDGGGWGNHFEGSTRIMDRGSRKADVQKQGRERAREHKVELAAGEATEGASPRPRRQTGIVVLYWGYRRSQMAPQSHNCARSQIVLIGCRSRPDRLVSERRGPGEALLPGRQQYLSSEMPSGARHRPLSVRLAERPAPDRLSRRPG